MGSPPSSLEESILHQSQLSLGVQGLLGLAQEDWVEPGRKQAWGEVGSAEMKEIVQQLCGCA